MLDDFISAASLAPISLNQLTSTRLKFLRVNKCRKDLVSKLLWRVKKTSYLTAVTTFSITHLSFSCCASWFPCCNSFCTWNSVKVRICYLYSDVLLASRNFQTSIQIATCLVPMTGQTNSHTFCYHQPDPTFQPAQMTNLHQSCLLLQKAHIFAAYLIWRANTRPIHISTQHSFKWVLIVLFKMDMMMRKGHPQVEESHLTPVAMWISAPVAAEWSVPSRFNPTRCQIRWRCIHWTPSI